MITLAPSTSTVKPAVPFGLPPPVKPSPKLSFAVNVYVPALVIFALITLISAPPVAPDATTAPLGFGPVIVQETSPVN